MDIYSAIKTEIVDPAYDGMSDADIAAAVNAKTVVVQGDISIAQTLSWCAAQGILVTIQGLAQTASPLQNIAVATMLMFNSLDSIFALTSPSIQGLVGAFVAGGIITSEQSSNLMALGQKTVPYTQSVMGVTYISADDITAARSR